MDVERRTETRRLAGLEQGKRPVRPVGGRLDRHPEPAEVDRPTFVRSEDKRPAATFRQARSSSPRCFYGGSTTVSRAANRPAASGTPRSRRRGRGDRAARWHRPGDQPHLPRPPAPGGG